MNTINKPKLKKDCEYENRRNKKYKSDCGILALRPKFLKKFATIQMFVLASCILVTLQQSLSSGYFNSVITTIEKRFDVPSRLTGVVASTFEIGNLFTIIFVSYFGTHRHIPVWIGKGVLITGIGSILFAIPHFMHDGKPPLPDNVNFTTLDDNMCHMPEPIKFNLLKETASHLLNVLPPEKDPRFCNEKGSYRAPHLIVFMIAMILIGCGGTPIFTLGTIYIDDHVKKEDSSMYLGCMYSMVAFGLMVGFLLGGYFITVHENSFGSGHVPEDIYNGHPKWIGAWWAGFVLLGILLIMVSVVFFAFPKSLKKDKHRKRIAELENSMDQCITITTTEQCNPSNNFKENQEYLFNCKNDLKRVDDNKNSKHFITDSNKEINISKSTNDQSNSKISAIMPLNNQSLTTNTTTKLQLSIVPIKKHHRHHSASATMNCASNLIFGEQTTIKQPIVCNGTAAIKFGHNRSISTSTIHHQIYHLHHHLHKNKNQSQDKTQCNKIKNDNLQIDIYDDKKDIKKFSIENEIEADIESSMDDCSLISSPVTKERKLKDIPSCMYALLTNPIYIVTCLGSCMELCIVSGFLVFLPKYLETQFSISKSQANLFAGGIAVPGACIGIFLGGYLLKKLQLKPKDAIQFVLFFNLVCMGLYTALYFLGCENPKMAGATHPYFNSSHLEAFQVNLANDCNRNCGCSPNDIEPVCGLNGITYFSPCHAGCQLNTGPRHTQNYMNCTCIQEHWPASKDIETQNELAESFKKHPAFFSLKDPIAINGPCKQKCKTMIPFLILLFVVTLVVSITQMPLLMVILRSVDENERAFALAFQFVLFRLFGYIPSPILFGSVIDSTCLLWKANCGRQGGFCLIYNIEHFRLRYVGVCSALKVAAGLLFFLDWLLICYRNRLELRQPVRLTINEFVNSIYTLDQQINSAINCDKDDSLKNEETINLNGYHDSDYNSVNDDEEISTQ